jgi:prepilin-type N-terminal cleavage/methylation domain-containing protein
MKKNGFTMVELLAVLILLGVLVIIAIPAYLSVYTSIRRENLNSKISNIETAALKYGSSIKDEIKDTDGKCISTSVSELIKNGYLISESDKENAIYNPTNDHALDGTIKVCYNMTTFDIEAYYLTDFNTSTYYYKGEYVLYNGKIYECVINYPGKGGIYATNSSSKKYFELIEY